MGGDFASAQFNYLQDCIEALGAHTLRETGKYADLLLDLLLAYEGSTTGNAIEVSLFDKIEDSLAYGREAKPEASRVFALLQ